MITIAKILDKIRKLIAIRDNAASSPGEIANAASMIVKMMAKYNLDNRDLIFEDLKKDDNLTGADIAGPQYDKNIPLWYNVLATAIGDIFECESTIVRVTVDGKRKLTFRIYGYTPDVEVSQWMFSYLAEQINKLADSAWKDESALIQSWKDRKPWASELTRFKSKYRYGVVQGILPRLRTAYEEQTKQEPMPAGTGTGLVVYKLQRIHEVFNLKHDREGVKRPRGDTNAIMRGLIDSKKVAIRKVVAGGNTRQQLEYNHEC